jgi:hypothetical protein
VIAMAGNFLKKSLFKICLLVISCHLLSSDAAAINFRDVTRAPDGIYPILYPIWFSADKITDKNGDTAVDNLGLDSYKLVFKTLFLSGESTYTLIIPTGRLEIDKFDAHDSGLGDIVLGYAYFLPIKTADIAPVVAVKLPTGSYDKNSAANIGSNQVDLFLKFYATKFYESFSVHSMVNYVVRFENPDTKLKPGNEFYAECLVTFPTDIGPRFGPSVVFVKGDNNEQDGKDVNGSGLMKLSLGAEGTHLINKHLSGGITIMYDVKTENAAEGHLILGKFSYFF